MSKQSNAIAAIRQLCCLGLDQATLISEFLRAVQSVIPSSSNFWAGFDHQCNLTYLIPDVVIPEVIDEVVQDHERLYTQPMKANIAKWFEDHSVLPDMSIISPTIFRSDIYNHVWRPYDAHHCLHAMIRSGNKPQGYLMIYRPKSVTPFHLHEQHFLDQMLPYLEHGIQAKSDIDGNYTASGNSGMLIMDAFGNIELMSKSARNLLLRMTYPVFPTIGERNGIRMEIQQSLRRLCLNLNGIFQGKPAPPPVWTHTNPRGRFAFRAQWLDRNNREPGGMIGVTVEFHEPLRLRLWRGMKDLPLSPMQRDVCLLLAQNYSRENIAQRLSIKPYTVKEYVRAIHDKLHVHSREELLARLTADIHCSSNLPRSLPC